MMKKIIAAVLAVSLLAAYAVLPAQAAHAERLGYTDMLHCAGTYLINRAGQAVTLRGTNLGNWLLQELWMSSTVGEGLQTQSDILSVLTARFGADTAAELVKEYEDNYITEADFDYIASLGFNCVRVPFWYRNFMSDDNGTWIRDEKGNIDFSRLDWVVSECAKRGIYVVLDMHGLPGFQSVAHHTGKLNSCKLYDDTPEGERFRALSCELWSEIARHFRGNPAVAAYDLMNEPMCDMEGEDKDIGKMWEVYDLLYTAVRKADPGHAVIMEAVWRFDNLPKPDERGWTNVIYELHLYNDRLSDFEDALNNSASYEFNVPVYVGEFKPTSADAAWADILPLFNASFVSWTTWTYRGHCGWGSGSDWFIRGTSGREVEIDISRASEAEIREAWGEKIRSENCCTEMGDIAALKAGAGETVKVGMKELVRVRFAQLIREIKVFFNRLFG